MEGCLAVCSEGRSGGLALMWREGVRVTVQNYSKYHIDASDSMQDGENLRFTGFYGQVDPRLRQHAWDMLRRVKIVESLPFLTSYIVRQSKSDHEANLMDTDGSKPNDKSIDQRAWFRYDHCWAEEKGARDIISGIWSNRERDTLEKMESVRVNIGSCDQSTSLLKNARRKLGHLYDVEERHWATRVHSQWLNDGDRNTRYFHVRASGHKNKNYIERLKDKNGNWHEDKKEICHIASN
ncbi:hypothetical protein GOBAR_DD19272 [Gossypium barbadense]|nr:hypothetical protein GOBAR_DD19272 [Gossypium barbadense]